MKFISMLFVSICSFPLFTLGCELADLSFLVPDIKVQYEFIQSKTVAALSRPLISSGVLGFSANEELIWQTQHPFKSTLVISAKGLKQFNQNDVLVSELGNPMVVKLSQIFLSLLSGNTQKLETDFTQKITCENGSWQISLTPGSGSYETLLSLISLSGTQYIEKITFLEARGDYTEILLSAPSNNHLGNFEMYLGD